jgi:hypothetical protein
VKEARFPHREALYARTRSPARKSWPVDRSLSHLAPERLFRRQPHFSFTRHDGGATERMGWRDLVLSENALRAGPAGGRRAPPNPNR